MQPDLSAVQTECGRDPLIAAITAFLARDHAPALGEIRESLQREIDAAGPEALAALGLRLADPGRDWSYYPSDPLARRIHRALAGRVLQHKPVLLGTGHLATLTGKPVVIAADALRQRSDGNRQVMMDSIGLAIAACSRRHTVAPTPARRINPTG